MTALQRVARSAAALAAALIVPAVAGLGLSASAADPPTCDLAPQVTVPGTPLTCETRSTTTTTTTTTTSGVTSTTTTLVSDPGLLPPVDIVGDVPFAGFGVPDIEVVVPAAGEDPPPEATSGGEPTATLQPVPRTVATSFAYPVVFALPLVLLALVGYLGMALNRPISA